MLDLFTIFSKGGIVLFYFQDTAEQFTNSVNELIKSVILQVNHPKKNKSSKNYDYLIFFYFVKERGLTSAWNHNTLSLQYKLDNEFELVFVVAYQNILKLTYIDKFLNEIQLRFRDKYKQQIQNKKFGSDFNDFKEDFDRLLRTCEEEARQSAKNMSQPRKYHESEKSTKTMASIMENKKGFLSSLVGSNTEQPSNNSNKGRNAKNTASIKENEDSNEENNSSLNHQNGLNSDEDNDNINNGSTADNEKKFGDLMNNPVRKVGGRPKKFEKPKS
jgi:signal recognition particle receptor subunit alpha